MAEVIAGVGLAASITTLIELSVKIVSRVRDYSANDVPNTFRSLANRLEALTPGLEHIRSQADARSIADDSTKKLKTLVDSILEQVRLVQQRLEGAIPAANASRFSRVLSAFKSLAKDRKVEQAVKEIDRDISVLLLHQNNNIVEASDDIRHSVGQLGPRNAALQQPAPPTQQRFGLRFGQAPLIEPDAFIGRQADVQRLHELLSPSQNAQAQRVVSIFGVGGMGKSQLSLAYAREYGHHYSSVFWLNAKDRTTLQRDMSAHATEIFTDSTVTPANTDEENTQVVKMRQWLSEAWNDQWLIIFDNYDDPSLPSIKSSTGFDIRKFFPTRSQGSVLVTTRRSKLSFSKSLKLEKLQNPDVCIAVLSQRSGRDMTRDKDARRLAAHLDGLPLALAVAGTYFAQTTISCTEYVDLYETAWNELHGPNAQRLMEYGDQTLSSTWTVSLDQIRRQDADAAELLQFLGYLNNTDIWYELIKAGTDVGPSWIGRVTSSKIRFDRAMSMLGDYSLVETKGVSYQVHPCLHDWVFEHLNKSLSETSFIATIVCLERSMVDRSHPQYWTIGRRLISHIDRVRHRRFTVLWDKNSSNEVVLDASDLFGKIYLNYCDFDSAEEMYVWTLAGKEKALGPDHTSTLKTVDNYGMLYTHQGKLDKAEQMLHRALAGYRKALEPDQFLVFRAMYHLGIVSCKQGKQDEAEQMLQQALTGTEKAFGPNHSATLNIANDLGSVYVCQGKSDEAERMLQRALTGMEKIVGPDHTTILDIVQKLGLVYLDQDRVNDAQCMTQRALTGMEKVVGLNHLSTLNVVTTMSNIYRIQGKFDEAEQMLKRVLAGQESALPPNHPMTLMTLSFFGTLYVEQGKLDEAELLFRRILSVYTGDKIGSLYRIASYGMLAILRKAMQMRGNGSTMDQSSLARLILHTERCVASNRLVVNFLARALVHIKDDENASIAFFHILSHSQDGEGFQGASCDGCDTVLTIATERYVCRQCEDVDLCQDCMTKYTQDDLSLEECHGHEYFDVVNALKEVPESQKEIKVEDWLAQLRKKHHVQDTETETDDHGP